MPLPRSGLPIAHFWSGELQGTYPQLQEWLSRSEIHHGGQHRRAQRGGASLEGAWHASRVISGHARDEQKRDCFRHDDLPDGTRESCGNLGGLEPAEPARTAWIGHAANAAAVGGTPGWSEAVAFPVCLRLESETWGHPTFPVDSPPPGWVVSFFFCFQ